MVRQVLSFVLVVLLQCVAALDNGVGVTPPMGWRRFVNMVTCVICIF